MKTGVVDGGIHRVGKRTRDVGRARGTVLSLAGTDLDSLNAIVMKTEQLEYAGNWSQLFFFRSNPMQSVGSMFHSFMSGSMCAESRGRMGFGPKIDLTQKQALNIQLHVLFPHIDPMHRSNSCSVACPSGIAWKCAHTATRALSQVMTYDTLIIDHAGCVGIASSEHTQLALRQQSCASD